MKKYAPLALAALVSFSLPVMAAKPCDQLKSELAAKLDKKGVKNYSLEIVAADAAKDQKVIGSCDSNSKRIVYTRK